MDRKAHGPEGVSAVLSHPDRRSAGLWILACLRVPTRVLRGWMFPAGHRTADKSRPLGGERIGAYGRNHELLGADFLLRELK